MDIAGAYGDEGIRRILRSFTFGETSVTLKDAFDCDGGIVERICSFEKPQVHGGSITIGEGKLTFDPTQATVSVSSELTTANGQSLWFTDFALTGKTFTLTME